MRDDIPEAGLVDAATVRRRKPDRALVLHGSATTRHTLLRLGQTSQITMNRQFADTIPGLCLMGPGTRNEHLRSLHTIQCGLIMKIEEEVSAQRSTDTLLSLLDDNRAATCAAAAAPPKGLFE